MADPLPFAQGVEVNDYQWTATAYDLMIAGQLVVTWRATARSVVATGRCPRCAHDVDYSFLMNISLPRGGPGTLGGGSDDVKGAEVAPSEEDLEHGDGSGDAVGANAQYQTIPILCQCREDHPGRPHDGRGCGIVFNTELLDR